MFKINYNFVATATLATCLGLVGCGKKKSATDSSVDVSTTSGAISTLPSVTGAVSSASALVLNSLSGMKGLSAAATGYKLKGSGKSGATFANGNSRAMCENASLMKEVLNNAGGPDKILCYLGKMADETLIPSNFTDGKYHYVQLKNVPGDSSGAKPTVKMKLTISGGKVTDFKMFSCFGGTPSSPTQTEYISQVFNTTTTVITKNVETTATDTYASKVTVTGSTASSGNWSSKNLIATSYWKNSGNTASNNQYVKMDQNSGDFSMTGWVKGTFKTGTVTDRFGNSFYTVAQILGSDKMSTFALGDGSSKYNMGFTSTTSSRNLTQTGTVSWDGDTKQKVQGGTYETKANAGTLPTIPGSVTAISFSGTEVWDCSLPSGETWTSVDFNTSTTISAKMTTCENEYGFGWDWVDCGAISAM